MKEMKILSPCGILGYGYPKESFLNGISKGPDLIAVDAGSTDAGPHKLGAGVGIVSRQAAKKDLELMLKAGYELKIPVIIGSAGGSGARPHVEWTMNIIREIISEQKLHFKTAVIWSDIEKNYIKNKMSLGQVTPLGPVPPLLEEDLDRTNSVVSQMGHEPIISALEQGAQLIVAGRAYDPSVFAAYPIMKGFNPGLSYHLGKILECGAICAEPGSAKDCIMGYLREDHFLIEAMSSRRKCYTTSIAAHTFYEKEHPYHLFGPGFELDLSECTYEQYGDGIVKVTGSRFIIAENYNLKMEGAAQVAFRTLVIAGIRDPIMIKNIEEIKKEVVETVAAYFEEIPRTEYQILFHLYGKDGVMGPLEPVKESKSHELGMVMDVVASTQELANTICASARSTMMHFGFKGRKATAGNLAFLYSPSDIVFGPVYKFTVYHLVKVDNPCELVCIEVIDL